MILFDDEIPDRRRIDDPQATYVGTALNSQSQTACKTLSGISGWKGNGALLRNSTCSRRTETAKLALTIGAAALCALAFDDVPDT